LSEAARAVSLAMPGCRLLDSSRAEALADSVYGRTLLSEGVPS
jgi:hypothetical protein